MTRWIRRKHKAMGTYFEAILGAETEKDPSVFEMLFEEIDRTEELLSRFDPQSEVSRINREARSGKVRVGAELFRLLETCREIWEKTGGAFAPILFGVDYPSDFGRVDLDSKERTVSFNSPDLALDFGGVGKGYALLRCREILSELGIENAFLHGGTSSILAIGAGPEGEGWRVGIRGLKSMESIGLRDRSLSSSGARNPEDEVSDLYDPRTGKPISTSGGCTVIGSNPLEVEILSTAFLVMGKAEVDGFLQEGPDQDIEILWWVG